MMELPCLALLYNRKKSCAQGGLPVIRNSIFSRVLKQGAMKYMCPQKSSVKVDAQKQPGCTQCCARDSERIEKRRRH